MKLKLISADQFQKSPTEGTGVVKFFDTEVKQIGDAESRTFEFRITTGAVDRDNDTINPSGWDVKNYESNPVVMWSHSYSQPPLGKAISLTKDEKGLKSTVEFTPKGMSPFNDMIFEMVKGSFIRSVSVGFRPIEYTQAKDESRPYGVDFKKQELLEYSLCSIPSNQECLIGAASAGIDIKPMTDWALKFLSDSDDPQVRTKLLELLKPEEKEAKELADKAAADEAKAAADKEAADKAAKELAEKATNDPNATLIAAIKDLSAKIDSLVGVKIHATVESTPDPKKELSDEVAMKQIKDRIAAHVTKTTGRLPAEF